MKEALAKLLLKRLEETGFKYHFRLCEQLSDYGSFDEDGFFVPDTEMAEEQWSNEDFINWLLDVGNKEISDNADEIRKLFAQKENDRSK